MKTTAPSSPVANNEEPTKAETSQMETSEPKSGASITSSKEMTLRLQKRIEGQMAILVKGNPQEITAVPLNLYNKRGRVVLSIESTKTKHRIWGKSFGHWSAPDPNVMTSSEYPLGFGVLVPNNKLFVSQLFYTKKDSNTVNTVFLVKNQTNQLVFVAKLRLNMKIRFLFGRAKQLDFKFYDPFKREVVFCRQLLGLSSCLSSCCLNRMEVMGQPSKPIGIIRQKMTAFGVELVVEDDKQNKLFRVKSTKSCQPFKYEEFRILSMDSKEIGGIRPSLKEDQMKSHEISILSIDFNANINAIQKTLLLSATFLIVSLFYERYKT